MKKGSCLLCWSLSKMYLDTIFFYFLDLANNKEVTAMFALKVNSSVPQKGSSVIQNSTLH